MTDEPVLRRAEQHDGHEIAAMWLRSRRASIPAIPAPVHSDEEIHAWFSNVVLRSRDAWVADDRGRVVGVLVVDGDWVNQLYVDPDHTGRGIGSRLIGHAKAVRPEGLELWTFAANAGARRFYERHGFVAIGGTDGDNEEGAPDVHYRWRP